MTKVQWGTANLSGPQVLVAMVLNRKSSNPGVLRGDQQNLAVYRLIYRSWFTVNCKITIVCAPVSSARRKARMYKCCDSSCFLRWQPIRDTRRSLPAEHTSKERAY